MRKGEWTFLTNHGLVLICLAKYPQNTIQEIARETGITPRGAQKIISDLEAAGYLVRQKEGRRNRYTVHLHLPMRHRLEQGHAVGDLLVALGCGSPQSPEGSGEPGHRGQGEVAGGSYVASRTKIKVVGLGRAGCGAITRMAREHIENVELIAMDTDAQNLAATEATVRVQLGERLTHGLGAGGDDSLGRRAAEESRDKIERVVAGADLVFIVGGMGGGTGTGAARQAAETARRRGALTIAMVTKPFSFEGTRRTQVAGEGVNSLADVVDTLITIPNDRLLDVSDRKTLVDGAFKMADDVLFHGVQAIVEVVTLPGLINLDFADIRSVMKDAGSAWMSIGRGSGQNRAVDAATRAISSPLLDISIEGAKKVLFKIVGNNLTLFEVHDAAKVIRQAVDPEANVIFGVVLDPKMCDEVRLTLIAAGSAARKALTGVARGREIVPVPTLPAGDTPLTQKDIIPNS